MAMVIVGHELRRFPRLSRDVLKLARKERRAAEWDAARHYGFMALEFGAEAVGIGIALEKRHPAAKKAAADALAFLQEICAASLPVELNPRGQAKEGVRAAAEILADARKARGRERAELALDAYWAAGVAAGMARVEDDGPTYSDALGIMGSANKLFDRTCLSTRVESPDAGDSVLRAIGRI